MRLPNGGRAELGTKLEDYTLNLLHAEGRHKAHVFRSVLGIDASTAHVLRHALLDPAARSDEVEAWGDNGFGDIYVLRFPLSPLLEDTPARHFDSGRPLWLRRGQVGTVVILPVQARKLMILRDTPDPAVA